jgi:hypothetical protein
LLALGVNLEDRGTRLGNLWQVDVHGRPIRVDGHSGFKMKGLPVLWEAIEEALNGPMMVVRRWARDGQWGQGSDELVVQAIGFAVVEDVS